MRKRQRACIIAACLVIAWIIILRSSKLLVGNTSEISQVTNKDDCHKVIQKQAETKSNIQSLSNAESNGSPQGLCASEGDVANRIVQQSANDQPVPQPVQQSALKSGPPYPKVVFSIKGKPVLAFFSARYDTKLESTVLIGYYNNILSKKAPRVSCRLVTQTAQGLSKSPWKELEEGQKLVEGIGKPYDGVLYFCPGKRTADFHVEVKSSDLSKKVSGSIEMPVQFADSKNFSNKVAVCNPPLRHVLEEESEASLIMRMVEFIEVNRLLGVDHYFFYNLSLPRNASKVLNHYVSLGLASVTQWSLAPGVDSDEDIHYYGQVVAIQDCLYAVRDRYRLAAFFDIDEFLVPINSKGEPISLEEAAKLHKLQDRGGNFALLFRNGVFPPFVESDYGLDATDKRRPATEQMPTSLKGCRVVNFLRKRRVKFIHHELRTKTLSVARQIKQMGIHKVWHTWYSGRSKTLDPNSEGFMHHFRHWPAGEMVDDLSMKPLYPGIETAVTRARMRLKNELDIDICAMSL